MKNTNKDSRKIDLSTYLKHFGRNTPVDFTKFYDTYVNEFAPDNSIKNIFDFMTAIVDKVKCSFLYHYEIDIVRGDLDAYQFRKTEDAITTVNQFHELYYSHLEREIPFFILLKDAIKPLPQNVELAFIFTFSQFNVERLQRDALFDSCLFLLLRNLKINPHQWNKSKAKYNFEPTEVNVIGITPAHKELLDGIPIDSSLMKRNY